MADSTRTRASIAKSTKDDAENVGEQNGEEAFEEEALFDDADFENEDDEDDDGMFDDAEDDTSAPAPLQQAPSLPLSSHQQKAQKPQVKFSVTEKAVKRVVDVVVPPKDTSKETQSVKLEVGSEQEFPSLGGGLQPSAPAQKLPAWGPGIKPKLASSTPGCPTTAAPDTLKVSNNNSNNKTAESTPESRAEPLKESAKSKNVVEENGEAEKEEEDDPEGPEHEANPFASETGTQCTYLVVDSGGFINNCALEKMSMNIVTLKEVLGEIKDENARRKLEFAPYKIETRSPSEESVAATIEFAKLTGDFRSLSVTDIKVIALARTLQVQFHGASSVNSRPKQVLNDGTMMGQGDTAIDGFFAPSAKPSKGPFQDGWITPQNYKQAKTHKEQGEDKAVRLKVGCLTTDFAMQNVLLQMGIHVVSVEGMLVTRLRTYCLRCTACETVTKEVTRDFCPRCGNNALVKASAVVDASGNLTYHISRRFRFITRGTIYPIPAPKGGRAPNIVLREDQKERVARQVKSKSVDVFSDDYVARASPFGSNSNNHGKKNTGNALPFGRVGYGRKNPNETRKKK